MTKNSYSLKLDAFSAEIQEETRKRIPSKEKTHKLKRNGRVGYLKSIYHLWLTVYLSGEAFVKKLLFPFFVLNTLSYFFFHFSDRTICCCVLLMLILSAVEDVNYLFGAKKTIYWDSSEIRLFLYEELPSRFKINTIITICLITRIILFSPMLWAIYVGR